MFNLLMLVLFRAVSSNFQPTDIHEPIPIQTRAVDMAGEERKYVQETLPQAGA